MPRRFLKFLVSVSLVIAGVFLWVRPVGAISASGPWSSSGGESWGSVSMNFPAEGGSVDGTFSGGGKYSLKFGGRFSGNFTGGWDGTFSGRFNGWYQVPTFEGQVQNGNVSGPWSGSLNSNGTIQARFTNTQYQGLDGKAALNFSTGEFEREYEANKPDSALIITEYEYKEAAPGIEIMKEKGFDPKEVEWKAKVHSKVENTYVIVDGKRVPLTDGFALRPGMVVETGAEGGQALFSYNEGRILLQGKGSRIKLMMVDELEKDEWDKVMRGQTRPQMMLLQSGSMVVKYEAGGKEGYWMGGQEREDITGEIVLVEVQQDSSGSRKAERDDDEDDYGIISAITGLLFDNHSVVEYNYDEEKGELEVKVYEGEAGVYKADSKAGKREETAKIKAGEKMSFKLAEFGQGTDEEMVKSEFDVKEKSEAVKSLMKESSWWGRLVAVIRGWFRKN